MDAIMVRPQRNDFNALRAANAMQSSKWCDVISIVCKHDKTYEVWAKYDSIRIGCNHIDELIDRDLEL